MTALADSTSLPPSVPATLPSWPVDQAAEERAVAAAVRAQVLAAGTSFYWAMRFLPRQRREAMFAIYAFCRAVDDVADGNDPPERRRALLDAWREEVGRVFAGAPQTAIGMALTLATERFGLRHEDMLAVIDGMQMDAEADIRAPSMAELDLYCARVASAVGLLSVKAFGAPEPHASQLANALGRALQLTNILRDVVEDAERGRLYLPRELLLKHGILDAAPDPRAALARREVQAVCADLGAVAEGWFEQARAAMAACPRRSVRPARVMMEVYARILA
ncbi:MAG: presqualene diphosphate synthase HpnD, partial [Alphaproteobacteria bacterium]|nr:presqualene diphosphate synthase HpnD [Alphaproteobacteria bacterium]